jgi:hypothetical protein
VIADLRFLIRIQRRVDLRGSIGLAGEHLLM